VAFFLEGKVGVDAVV